MILKANMFRMKMIYLFSMAVIMTLVSCNGGNIYTEKIEIKDDVWTYSDSLKYSFEIKDTAQLYTMQLNVRHNEEFPFENCYVKIHSIYPDQTSKNDVLSLEFADDSGTWMGEKDGNYLKAPIAIQPIAKFKKAGKYTMVFYQNSRVDSLKGINSLELILNKKAS